MRRKMLCLGCQDKPLPTHRTRRRQFSVHFTGWVCGMTVITLDGVDVTNRCFAGHAGAHGYVALYREDDGHRHICEVCGREAAAELRYGDVKLVWTDPAAKARDDFDWERRGESHTARCGQP